MKSTLYLTLAFALISFSVQGQELRPYQFIQFFKFYQLESSIHLSAGTDCLRAYDKQWLFMETFTTINETADMHFWLYGKEDIQRPKHRVNASTNKQNGSHYVEYEFDEPSLYQQYLTQINNMNPEDGGISKTQGGTGRIYNVGNWTFVLRTFPPGIKAETTMYTIALSDIK